MVDDGAVPPSRAGGGRLGGLRLVTTILEGGRSDSDDGRAPAGGDLVTLLRERLDAVLWIGAGEDGLPMWTRRAHLLPPSPGGEGHRLEDRRAPGQDPWDFLEFIENLEAEFDRTAPDAVDNPDGERAVLVAFERRHQRETSRAGPPLGGPSPAAQARQAADWSMGELEDLVRTSGGEPVDRLVQKRDAPDAATLVGRGFVRRIQERVLATAADIVVLDRELSPSQTKNLEAALDCKVLDRTQVILDIFAQRARSAQGRSQVELARLRYLLPRLVGAGAALSRLGGGIGSSRGLGEKKLELDRRYVRRRIAALERRLALAARHRETARRSRERSGLLQVALVGYTNAGKSTLLNALTRSDVAAESRLFATLDPTARRLPLPAATLGRDVIVSDTVGFIRDLPVSLFEAFRATFEEIGEASLLLVVADAADPHVFEELRVTDEVLAKLGLGAIPRRIVFTKRDLVRPTEFAPLARTELGETPWTLVSARDPADREALRDVIVSALETLGPSLETASDTSDGGSTTG